MRLPDADTVHDGTSNAVPHAFKCRHCRGTGRNFVDPTRWMTWQDGEPIQNVWPDMSPDHRESLRLGLHPECLVPWTQGVKV